MPTKTEPDTNRNTSNQTSAGATSGLQRSSDTNQVRTPPCPTCKGTGVLPVSP